MAEASGRKQGQLAIQSPCAWSVMMLITITTSSCVKHLFNQGLFLIAVNHFLYFFHTGLPLQCVHSHLPVNTRPCLKAWHQYLWKVVNVFVLIKYCESPQPALRPIWHGKLSPNTSDFCRWHWYVLSVQKVDNARGFNPGECWMLVVWVVLLLCMCEWGQRHLTVKKKNRQCSSTTTYQPSAHYHKPGNHLHRLFLLPCLPEKANCPHERGYMSARLSSSHWLMF